MKFVLQSPIKEAVLALLRIVVLAVIPIAIQMFESEKIDWRVLAVTAAIALLKGIDEYIHTVGKNNENESQIKGLVRF
jgi:hypothetical protein